jgi:hypothetical protein
MIRSLRAYFLGRALREKILLFAFFAIGLLWWLSAFGGRAGVWMREQKVTTARLSEQAQWIKNRGKIEETARQTAAKLDPAQTLNGNQLATTISQLAREAGLPNSQSGVPTTTRSGQFALHSVDYTIRGADYDSVLKFYRALGLRSPYLAVERFRLEATPNNPAQLTLALRVSSVEIARP